MTDADDRSGMQEGADAPVPRVDPPARAIKHLPREGERDRGDARVGARPRIVEPAAVTQAVARGGEGQAGDEEEADTPRVDGLLPRRLGDAEVVRDETGRRRQWEEIHAVRAGDARHDDAPALLTRQTQERARVEFRADADCQPDASRSFPQRRVHKAAAQPVFGVPAGGAGEPVTAGEHQRAQLLFCDLLFCNSCDPRHHFLQTIFFTTANPANQRTADADKINQIDKRAHRRPGRPTNLRTGGSADRQAD